MLGLARSWWVLVLRGVLAVIFGIIAFLWPGVTVAWFVLLFGAYAIVDGIISLLSAARSEPGQSRWTLVPLGIVSLIAGVFVITQPAISAVVLLYVIAIWAIASGIAAVIAAFALRKEIAGEWYLIIYGIVSILLGIILLTRPAAGVLGFVWAISLYATIAGITLVILGFRLRAWARSQDAA